MKTHRIFILAACLTLAVAYGKEGADQYPYGAENWFTGALPPPGDYFINYFGYYTGTLRDNTGAKVNLAGTTPSVNAVFDAVRFVHVTHVKILGAEWGVQFIAPFVYQSVDMGGTASRFSQGDLDIDPLLLGWKGEHWHAVAAFDTDVPTGYYDKNDARTSVGAHYYSFEPIFAYTYTTNSHWEASAKVMYNMKTTNHATDYHSGDEFHVDFVAGKHIGPWALGASGYVMKQVTNDTINGQIAPALEGFWDAGREGQVFAIGPSVTYATKKHIELIAQWQPEMLVRNRFGGSKLWFKMVIPL
jgi:hypothetical protein